MKFLELLQSQEDRANLNELIEAKKLLPDRVTGTIPGCMYVDLPEGAPEDSFREMDLEVVLILSFVMAKRENPEITMKEVGDRIGIGVEGQIKEVIKKITYFYTTLTREVIEKLHSPDTEDDTEGDTENPILEKAAIE